MSVSSKARSRIEALLDANSFVEIGAGVRARNTDFGLIHSETPSDGVVTGYGVMDGRLVYVYSQDPDVLGGSIGEMHARKIVRLYDLAVKMGAPVIGLLDSSGMRLQEATDAMNGLGAVFGKQAASSGVIPQITVVYGGCGGGLAVLASLSDFVFMEKENGRLFVNAPNAVSGNYVEKCDTSKADFRSGKTASVDLVCEEKDLPREVRRLMDLLPSNNEDDDAYDECTDDLNRTCDKIAALMDDPAKAVTLIADNKQFFETKQNYAPDMVTGFIRLNGAVVGITANRKALLSDDGKPTQKFDAHLTANACMKAARFVNFCDAFGIPVLSIAQVEGFASSMDDECTLASQASALVYAFAQATVPKVTLMTGKVLGSAALVMNAISASADLSICFADTRIGAMEAKEAAAILTQGKNAEETKKAETEYKKLQNAASSAASHGYVDEIIEPADVRKYLIGAFEMLCSKREESPVRKHGAI